jgi:hypothetical protein
MIRTVLVTLIAWAGLTAGAGAEGTLGLDEVLTAVAKAPKLAAEIQAELDRNNLKAAEVTCIAARHLEISGRWSRCSVRMRNRQAHDLDRG